MLSLAHWSLPLGAIRKELAPLPGRYVTLWRYLIACAIVIVASLALQVPFLALSLVSIFSTTQQNTYLTRLSGLVCTIGLTLAVACTLLLLRLTFDVALLRILAAMFILLCAMYFLRKSKLGVIGFLVGIVVVYIQSEVDVIPNPEALTRAVLWVWIAIAYPIAVNLLVGQLLPASADAHLATELRAQLDCVADSLQGAAPHAPENAAIEDAFLRMRRHLGFALAEHPAHAKRNLQCKARVRVVERLLVASRALPSADASSRDAASQLHVSSLLAAISNLQARLPTSDDGAFAMPVPAVDLSNAPAPLAAMHRAFAQLEQDEAARPVTTAPAAAATPSPVPGSHPGLDPAALRFALKVVLATQLGYLFYTAVNWPGIHTCMLTCIILALPSLGAVTHKGTMRLIGAALGSLAALCATVFIIPHLDSITGLLLLSLMVIACGAWIAAGSPRSDYVGFQMVFCFALALFGTFGPSTDLTEIRDRAIGIVLGVLISLLVYAGIWPEHEADKAPQAEAELSKALERLAETAPAGMAAFEQARADAWSLLERLRQLQGRLAFEPGADRPLDKALDDARRRLLDCDWLASTGADGTKP